MMPVALIIAALMTPWGERVTSENCWRDYPRPQMVRANWTCLNGDWDYAITSVTNTPGNPWDPTVHVPVIAKGKIRVPYPLESALSGVGRALEADQFLWYTRRIEVDKRRYDKGERVLLHFGAVDYRAMVFIGHREVTEVPHEGGNLPFTLDITDYVKAGENTLTLCVWDPTEGYVNPHGKQSLKPRGCDYTRVSGIWQTVWLEHVPKSHIVGYRVWTDIDEGKVKIEVEKTGSGSVEVAVGEDGEVANGRTAVSLTIADGDGTPSLPKSTFDFRLANPHLWSPEDPYLYNFTLRYGEDEVKGYFALRKFEKRRDANGVLRFFLNHRPYYVMGTLDQGWWPDGLLTPPSAEAMAHDIRVLKDCGFNTMRKHIKVEPLAYYALCDRLGILVLQDLASCEHNRRSPAAAKTVAYYAKQREEQKAMMDVLQAVPSIVMWIPYNEGWSQPGEFLTHSMLDFVRRYDPTRLVGGPSGSWDWEGGQQTPSNWKWTNRVQTVHRPLGVCEAGDTVDLHCYRSHHLPGQGLTMLPVNERRVSFLGEFGGLGHPVEGHLWQANLRGKGSWGYGGMDDTATREGLEKTYLNLMRELQMLAGRGLGGSIYTQTTDVEIEINGLMTYDRKVLKFDPAVLRRAHAEVIRAATFTK